MSGLVDGLVRSARPKQWVKNVLVFAAPASAGLLTQLTVLGYAVAAFAAFCLASSGTYFLNDAADIDSDRRHATKRLRPMAAGVFTPATGRAVGVLLLAAGLLLAALTRRWQLLAVLAVYVVNTTAYSTWLKHIAVFDVMSVAGGFLLRAIGGGAATRIPLSNWFLIVASFGSLFMVVGKRFAEHHEYADAEGGHVRVVMGSYPVGFLIYLRAVSSGAVLVAYCLFAFEKADLVSGDFPWYQLSIVPFVAAIFRYALLVELGQGEEPEDIVFRDRGVLLAGLCWASLFVAATYWGG